MRRKEKILTLLVNNKEKSYLLTSDTKYYKDDEKVSIMDFKSGDDVTITVDEGEVTKMVYGEDEEDEETDGYRIGTVKSINTSSKAIKLTLNNGDTESIYLASTYKIIDSDGATAMKLADLSKGDKLIVSGKYKSSKYTASVVVVYYE